MFHAVRPIIVALTLTLAYFGATSRAQADPLTFTLSQQQFTVTPGGGILFGGTLTNPNADSFSLFQLGFHGDGGPTDVAWLFDGITDTPGPLMPAVINGFTSATGNFFMMNIKPDAQLGSYSGAFYVRGYLAGIHDPLHEIEVQAPFAVTVVPAEVPEPASLLLLGTGLAGSLGVYRKRKQRMTLKRN